MNVRYTDTARAEVAEILVRIANDNPAAATSVATAIRATVAHIRLFPLMAAKTDVAGVHVKIARPFGYLVFYSIGEETAVIRNVRHAKRLRPSSD